MIPMTQIISSVPPIDVPIIWAVPKDTDGTIRASDVIDGSLELFGKLIKTDITGDNEAEDEDVDEDVYEDV